MGEPVLERNYPASSSINTGLSDIFKLVWITLLSLGILLYITRVHRKLGKDFIMGGVAMGALVQFVFPTLANIG